MSDLSLILVSVGATLTAVGIVADAIHTRREIAELKRRLNEFMPASPHSGFRRARRDVAEAILFDLAHVAEENAYERARIEYAIGRAQHIAAGGNPDDKPTEWKSS